MIDGITGSAQSGDNSTSSDDNSSDNDPGLVVTDGASTSSDIDIKSGSTKVEDASSDSTTSPATDISGSSQEVVSGSSNNDERSTSGSGDTGISDSAAAAAVTVRRKALLSTLQILLILRFKRWQNEDEDYRKCFLEVTQRSGRFSSGSF